MLSDADVRRIVRDTVRDLAEEPHVTQATRYWDDLRWDKISRETIFQPVVEEIEASGEGVLRVIPSDLQRDVAVKDTSKRFWKAVLRWRNDQS